MLGTPTDTITYAYTDASWGDLLTAYDGITLLYDAIGNLSYDGEWTYAWQHGRQLQSMYDGTQEVSFTYDANGMRKTKNTGSWTYTYTYNGSQLTQMTFLTSEVFYFTYDPQGHPATVKWNNHLYHYVTNLQGDVIAILDQGTVVVEYSYDAWGKVLSVTGSSASSIGVLNPLTYRGYVYDHETGLYYLQSRYYNPEWGRFINSDVFAATGQGLTGNNMFVYCGNNPVSRSDDGGYFWDIVFDVVSLVVSVIEVVNNPDDVGAWIGLAGDVIDVVVPCVGGVGETVRAANTARKVVDAADDVHDAGKVVGVFDTAGDTVKAAKKVHGNSLDYPGTNFGYILSDKTTGEVVKYGESINPARRYTKKFLNGANPINRPLDMTVVISGTKRDVHIWQHEQIADFYEVVGRLPALNKSKW